MVEDWLSKALDLFPELAVEFERAGIHPLSFWIELYFALVTAYEQQPTNDDLIGRIYDYAAWCFEQPETDDIETDISGATAFGLIEDIPLNPKVSADLHRWMSVESFLGFENLFRYHLDTETAYRKFRDEFMEKKRSYSGPSRI